MPTILRILGYRFYFCAMEGNEPPHVHIDKGAGTLKIWLDELQVAYRKVWPSEIRAALKLTREHKALLLQS